MVSFSGPGAGASLKVLLLQSPGLRDPDFHALKDHLYMWEFPKIGDPNIGP